MDVTFDADDLIKVVGITVVLIAVAKALIEFGAAAL
ncbi:hypothetical protein LCGC14_1250930 [marine sediment metagenome]|uniref:Uncharacterized protein n=1 Tax=marine sediment metagenome TaxID=412755 RepID=A0A0F9NK69_9ZZZZ